MCYNIYMMRKFLLLSCICFFFCLPLFGQPEYYTTADISDPACGYWISFDGKKPNGSWFLYVIDGTLRGDSIVVPGLTTEDCASVHFGHDSYEDYPIQKPFTQIPVLFSPWIYSLKKEGPGKWTNGYIIDPRGCSRFKCKAIFHKADGKKFIYDTLEIRGEIGLGIGKSLYWKRVTKDEAYNLQ